MGRQRLSDGELMRRGSLYYVGYRASKAATAVAIKCLFLFLIFAAMGVKECMDMPEIAKARASWFRQHGIEVQEKYRTAAAKEASALKFKGRELGVNYDPRCLFDKI